MSCERTAEYFVSRPPRAGSPPRDVQAHLDSCPHCARLWAESSAEDAGVSDDTLASVTAAIEADLTPVKPLPQRVTLALGFLSIFGLVSTTVIVYLGTTGTLFMSWLQLAGLLSAILVAAGMLAITLSGEMVPGDRQWAPLAQQGWAIGLGLAALAAVLFPWEFSENWLGGVWHCFQSGFVFSLPAAALALALLGRGSVLSWPTVGGGAGLLAGLVGATALHLGCPMQTAPHVTVGHMALPALCGAIGWCFGKLMPNVAPVRRVSH